MEPLIWFLLDVFLLNMAWAFPSRSPRAVRDVAWAPGHAEDVLIVKLAEDRGLWFDDAGALHGPGDLQALEPLLTGSAPLFRRPPAALRQDRETWDPLGHLADLTLWRRIEGPDAENRGVLLLADDRVETAYLAFLPVEPPADIPPTTPDLTGEQGYLGSAPDGFGILDALAWPGGRGAGVTLGDVEYDWRTTHEDLETATGATRLGWDSGYFDYHGTGVLGIVLAGDNGYGVTGMAPDVTPVVVSPYSAPSVYDVAAMIDEAAAVLEAGDVLLIEQQAYHIDAFCPVEIDPAVWDAISLAVAKGVVVVEPAGNAFADLDDADWDGWFQRDERDSGAILVGGGTSPAGGWEPRSWYPYGGSYGSRVDVQGWYDSTATTTSTFEPDLFFPEDDYDQAYTSQFGGTSGASAQVAAVAVIAQATALATRGAPWDPWDLRVALVNTGTPQPETDAVFHPIGPQPDLRRFLRTWGVR